MNGKVLENKILDVSALETSNLQNEKPLSEPIHIGENHQDVLDPSTFVDLSIGLDIEAIKAQEINKVEENTESDIESEVTLPPLQEFPLNERGRAMVNVETTGGFSWPNPKPESNTVSGARLPEKKIDGTSLISGHYSPDGVYMSGPMPSTAAGHYGPGGAYSAGPMPSTTGFSSWGPTPTLMTGPGEIMNGGAPNRPIMTGLPEGMHPLEIIQQRARQNVGQMLPQGQPQQIPPQAQAQIIGEVVESIGQMAREGQLQLPAPAQQAAMDVATQAMRGAAVPDPEASFAWLASSVASGLASLSALMRAYQGVPEMQTAVQDARIRVAQVLAGSGLAPQAPQQQMPQQQMPQQQMPQQQMQEDKSQLVAATTNAAQTIAQLAQAVSNVVAQKQTPQGQQVAQALQAAAQQAQQAAQTAQQAAQQGNGQLVEQASQQTKQLLDQARQLATQMAAQQ